MRMAAVAAGMVLAVSAPGARCQGDARKPADAWAGLVAANNLDVQGKPPFYLEIAFQLYDLNGKATEMGTVEDWWSAPDSERIVVRLSGLNEDGSATAGASHELARNRYLVNELLNLAVHPVRAEVPAGSKVTVEKESFGKVKLDCFGDENPSGSGRTKQGESFCVQPQTEIVLVQRGGGADEVLVRQPIGTFHGTYVGMKLQLTYLGRTAITGELTTLRSFDATQPDAKLMTLSPQEKVVPHGPMFTGQPKGVVVGRTTERVQPKLPDGDGEGKATMDSVVGRDGRVLDVVPISCSNAAFCDVAERAFRQWKYSPSLLYGQPTEVTTSNTINVWRE